MQRRPLIVLFVAVMAMVTATPPASAHAGHRHPAKPGSWRIKGNLTTGREFHTATLLNDGRLLVAGGRDGSGNPLASAEVYNPRKGTWSPTGSMTDARMFHTATLLTDGKVLVAGGNNTPTTETDTAEIFDPATGTWSPADSLNVGRSVHTAVRLTNGQVLVAGGQEPVLHQRTATAELYDPVADLWTPTGPMNVARYQHTATLLTNARVLVAGGFDNGGNPLDHAEVYNPATGVWTATAPMSTSRYVHAAERTLLPGGKVLVTGGLDDSSPVTATPTGELFDPAGTWSPTTSFMTQSRYFHTATLLPSGKVLIVGGAGGPELGFNRTATAELFDPATGVFTQTGSLSLPRYQHTATLIKVKRTGEMKVLVVGGSDGGAPFTRTELYTLPKT